LQPGASGYAPCVVVRLTRKESAIARFVGLTQRIGDLTSEVTRRQRAEHSAAAALAEQVNLQQRLSALADGAGDLLVSPSSSDLMAAIGALSARLLPADAHAVWRYDQTSNLWRAVWQRQLSDRFVAMATPRAADPAAPFTQPQLISDVASVPWLANRHEMYAAEGIRSLLIVPLRILGKSFGTIVGYYRAARTFSEADRHVATALGNLASAAVTTASLYEAQARSREAAEHAERHARFLAQASAALASSLDYERTLATVANLAVPSVADWCAVDVVAAHGSLTRLAVAHVDRAKRDFAMRIRAEYPEDPHSPYGPSHVVRTGEPVLVPAIPDELLVASARDDQHLSMIRQLGLVSYMCVPLRAGGRVLGVLSFVSAESGRHYAEADLRLAEDIAGRAALAVENAHAYAEARRANQLKDEFLATLSHELRTPLNAILGYVRMLRGDIIPADRRPRALDIVERNATALSQMVEDVLDVSRIVAGKIRLNVQRVDLPRVLQDAIGTVQPAADAKNVRLTAVIDPLASPVAGDPERLQQVVWNLLSNAVKFTPKGGRVQLILQRINSHVEVVVSDTGAGISPAFLPHVFERFRQEDSRFAREHGGLGLGLAITRHIVESHGGQIRAESGGENRGATFRVELPLLLSDPIPTPDPDRFHPTTNGTWASPQISQRLHGLSVLAVDDDPDARSLLREVLEAAGARVTTATSAGEALRTLAEAVPDVLVSDIGMPGMDGFEMIRAIRQSPDSRMRGLPAAALTAYARSEDRIEALRSGFQLHLAKPINPSELVEAVGALARQRDAPQG
jgi:signal transduction histidine kinase/ActR/RegA family two-component response regulator